MTTTMMMMMMIGGGGLTSITLFVRAAACQSSFMALSLSTYSLIFSGTLMMALKAKILNGKSRSKSLSVELSLGGCSIGWLGGRGSDCGLAGLVAG